jgi:hypothetical protein
MPSMCTPVGILRISPSTVIDFSTVSGKADVAPISLKVASSDWPKPRAVRSR